MAEDPRPRLGRGLAALLGETAEEAASVDRGRGQRRVPIEFLRANPRNPRKSFTEDDLSDLSDSIRERGVLQPILVRPVPNVADAYEIVAGERRWRAAQRAGVHDVPVLVIEATDREALEIAIVENVQRSDLNALEEAVGYERLMADFGHTQLDLSKIIGKSRSHIANTLRLMKLPEASRAMLADGRLSAGHARALLSLDDPDAVARRIVEEGLTVRDVERLGQDVGVQERGAKPRPEKDADTRALEKNLGDQLGMIVTIKHRGESGEVAIKYRSLEQLEALCHRLQAE
jgi:ParB family chromosome partitioning protein